MYAYIIEDIAILPYKVGVDEYNFTVFTENIVKSGENTGKRKSLTHGHYRNLEGALLRIAHLKSLEPVGRLERCQRVTIEGYLDALSKVTLPIIELLKRTVKA